MKAAVRAICGREAALGVALAGLSPIEATTGADAAAALGRLARTPGKGGVVLIEQALYDALPAAARRQIRKDGAPILVPFPGPGVARGRRGARAGAARGAAPRDRLPREAAMTAHARRAITGTLVEARRCATRAVRARAGRRARPARRGHPVHRRHRDAAGLRGHHRPRARRAGGRDRRAARRRARARAARLGARRRRPPARAAGRGDRRLHRARRDRADARSRRGAGSSPRARAPAIASGPATCSAPSTSAGHRAPRAGAARRRGHDRGARRRRAAPSTSRSARSPTARALTLAQRWPVRTPRPVARRLPSRPPVRHRPARLRSPLPGRRGRHGRGARRLRHRQDGHRAVARQVRRRRHRRLRRLRRARQRDDRACSRSSRGSSTRAPAAR